MPYIIAGLVILVIAFVFAKHVLFNPRINSIINALILIIAIVFMLTSLNWNKGPVMAVILSLLIIVILPFIVLIDCIRDVIIAKKFYKDTKLGLDKLYIIKSLSVLALIVTALIIAAINQGKHSPLYVSLIVYLFIIGLPRIIFLFVVNPLIHHSVSSDIKRKITTHSPLPYNESDYSQIAAKCYYHGKIAQKLLKKGLLVTNIETVKNETNISRDKLAKMYPEKLLTKLADMIAGDKETKEMRKNAEEKLTPSAISKHGAFLGIALYERYAADIVKFLLSIEKTFSPCNMKLYEELSGLNLMQPLGLSNDSEWSEYFIIQALDQSVKDGMVQDGNYCDDPLVNHSFGVKMKSVDGPPLDDD